MSQTARIWAPSICSRLRTCTVPMPPTPTNPMRTRSIGGAANGAGGRSGSAVSTAPGIAAPRPVAMLSLRKSRRPRFRRLSIRAMMRAGRPLRQLDSRDTLRGRARTRAEKPGAAGDRRKPASVLARPPRFELRGTCLRHQRPHAAAEPGAERRRRERTERTRRARQGDGFGNLIPEQSLGGVLRSVDERTKAVDLAAREEIDHGGDEDVAFLDELIEPIQQHGPRELAVSGMAQDH